MAYPVVQDTDTSNGTQGSNSTNWTLTYPTNIASGNLLLLFIGRDGAAATPTLPAGWNILINSSDGNCALIVAYKFATGSESGTFSYQPGASEQGSWRIVRITGAHASEVPDIGTAATGNDSNPNPPSCTAGWGAEDNLWFACYGADNGATDATAYPTDFTNGFSDASGGGPGGALGTCRREYNSTDTLDPSTFTIDTSEQWVAQTIVVRPAAAAAQLAANLTATATQVIALTTSIALAGAFTALAAITPALPNPSVSELQDISSPQITNATQPRTLLEYNSDVYIAGPEYYAQHRLTILKCLSANNPTTETNFDLLDSTYFPLPIGHVNARLSGNTIHFAVFAYDENTTKLYQYWYATYVIGTGWGVKELIQEGKALSGKEFRYKFCDLALRSDGDVIFVYSGEGYGSASTSVRAYYARRESGSWTTGLDINPGTGDEHGLTCILGSNDRVHILLSVTNATYHRTLLSDNSWGHVAASTGWGEVVGLSLGKWDDAGTVKIRAPYKSANVCRIGELTSADSPTPSNSAVEDLGTDSLNFYFSIAVDENADTIYVYYHNQSTNTLRRAKSVSGGAWSYQNETVTAPFGSQVPQAYTRNGTDRIGYAIARSDNRKFEEFIETSLSISLAATLNSTGTQTAALTTAIPLASSLSSTGTQTAALTTAIPLASSLSSTGTQVSALTTQITLASSLTGTGTASFNTLQTQITMAASLSSTGTQTVALTTSIPLASSLSASGTQTSALTTSITLASSLTGTATQVSALANILLIDSGVADGTTAALACSSVNVKAGDLIVVFSRAWCNGGQTINLPSDGDTNTYTAAGAEVALPTYTDKVRPFYAIAGSDNAALVVTSNLSASAGYHFVIVHVYRGVNTLDVNQEKHNTGSGTTLTTDSYTTGYADEVLIAFVQGSSPSGSVSSSTGLTKVQEDAYSSKTLSSFHQIFTSIQTSQTETVTYSTSGTDITVWLLSFYKSAGVAAQLEADLDSTGTQTAALTTSIPLASSLSSTGTQVSALTTSITAAASLSATGTQVVALTTSIPLAASFTGTGTQSNTDLTTQITLVAALNSTGTQVSALTTQITMASSLSATGTFEPDTILIGDALSATLDATGTQTAALTTQITCVASLTNTNTLTVALTTSKPLASSLSSTGTQVSALTTVIALASSRTGTATQVSALTTQITPAASLSSIGTLSATLTVSGAAQLEATLASTGTFTPDTLQTQIPLAASFSSTGTQTSALTTQIAIESSLTGTATFTPSTLQTSIRIAASLNGIATQTSSLSTAIPLAASFSSSGTQVSALTTQIALAFSGTGSATQVSALTTSITLAASLTCSSSITGTIPDVEFYLSVIDDNITQYAALSEAITAYDLDEDKVATSEMLNDAITFEDLIL